MSEPLSIANRDAILADLPEMLAIAQLTTEWFKGLMEKFREEIASFGNFPSLFLGIVKDDNGLTFYDGKLRIIDSAGHEIAKGLEPSKYAEILGEKSRAVELPEINLLQTKRISRRHLSGRPPCTVEHSGSLRNSPR